MGRGINDEDGRARLARCPCDRHVDPRSTRTYSEPGRSGTRREGGDHRVGPRIDDRNVVGEHGCGVDVRATGAYGDAERTTPNVTVAVTALVAVSITEMLFEAKLAT